jgi:hypothetical protein
MFGLNQLSMSCNATFDGADGAVSPNRTSGPRGRRSVLAITFRVGRHSTRTPNRAANTPRMIAKKQALEIIEAGE